MAPEAQELLLRSALEVGDEIAYWLGRMDDTAQRARVLADKARTRIPVVRQRTAEVLGTQDVPESVEPLLALALSDPDLVVRHSARTSLTKLNEQRPTIVERLDKKAASKQRDERKAALEALIHLPLRELPVRLRRPVLATRVRVEVAQFAQASVATPTRRAVVTVAGILGVVALLAFIIGYNTYFIALRPSMFPREQNEIVIRRGLPFLPFFSVVEVDTGFDVTQISQPQTAAFSGQQLWGAWAIRGKREYDQWGKDLAVNLDVEDGLPLLWYMDQDEGLKWLFEALKSSDVYGSGQAEMVGAALLRHPAHSSVQQEELLNALLTLLKDNNSNGRYYVINALGSGLQNPQFSDSARVVDALLPLLQDSNISV